MANVNVAQNLEGLKPTMNEVKDQARELNGSLEFDPEALSKRYAAEKNARLEPGYTSTYRHVLKSGLSHFLDDPWSNSPIIRDPVEANHVVIIVGGGYGGLLMAVRLLEAGINDILIVEKGSDFGGTW